MIIDFHTHAWPDKIAQKAREHLEGMFRVKLVGEPTVDTLLRSMDRNRIDISVICAVATRPEQVASINDWLFGVRSDRLRAFAALHPDFAGWPQELQRIQQQADGVKFQPEFQNFYVDEERMFPIYEAMEDLGIPVLFHCGKELSGTMLVRSSPVRLKKVKKAFPKLTIIAGHFGGFELWPEVDEHLLGEDLYFDTAFFFGHLPQQEAARMLKAHPAKRLLFGTDFPLIDPRQDLEHLNALPISDDLKERILFRNALQILKKS